MGLGAEEEYITPEDLFHPPCAHCKENEKRKKR